MFQNFPIQWVVFFVFIVNLLFTLIAFKKISKEFLLRNYFLCFLSITSIWLLSNFFTAYFVSTFFLKMSYAIGAAGYISCLILGIGFVKQNKIKNWQIVWLYFIASILFICCLLGVFFHVEVVNNDLKIMYTNWFIVYLSIILICSVSMIFIFIISIKKFTGIKKLQAKYMLLGSIMFTTASTLFSFILPAFGIENKSFAFLDTCSSLFFVSGASYAIIKHRLMDIDLAWRYSLSYSLYIVLVGLFICGPIIFLMHSFMGETIIGMIIISILTLFVIPPIYQYLIKKIKPAVLGKKYSYWQELDKLVQDTTGASITKDIISMRMAEVEKIMNLESITLYNYRGKNKGFCPYEKFDDEGKAQKLDTKIAIQGDDELINLLKLSAKPVFKEELLREHSHAQKQLLESLEYLNAEAVFPLFVEGELVAILCLGKKKDGKMMHEEDMDKILDIVRLTENSLSMEIEHRDRMLKIGDKYQKELTDASKRIINIKDIDELSKTIINIILQNTNSIYGTIYLHNKEAQRFIKKYEEGKNIGHTIESVSEENYLAKILLDKQQNLLTSELRHWAEVSQLTDIKGALEIAEQIGCEIIVPIVLDNLLGFICLGQKLDGEMYSSSDKNTIDLIAYTSAMAIQNIIYSVDIVLDPLTKIYNKKYCDEQMTKSINQSIRHKENLSCVMIDIDYFKGYNDRLGHQYGDVVLGKFGEYLKSMIRPNDFVCRYGGEEFMMILPMTDLKGARTMAERVRKEIKNKIKLKEPITISLGVATLTTNVPYKENSTRDISKIKQEFIERADKALYDAKDTGRDRVCVSKEMKLEEE
jgi:diguanylate cyclase (GGDEF)-like protein